ncbi:hypothetical protein [Pelosinus propionicus]|uniref:Secreted protein n=1 Tax=Pelosinus propionicus DSM 13327 TaxID=1123291 RepID=A0A1I4MM51_9FIRM|nr:hypothetical protein [Pelosinus propionicus]SFM04351.1 hypothetical protein SAMN04490355_103538 [Pelosinus propionicus DSM 13327]
MNTITKRCICLFSILMLTVFSHIALAAADISQTNTTFHMTGQVTAPSIQGFYGIIGDDGVKYQPINLPRKFKKDGLTIQFDTKLKANTMSTFQWGKIIEVSNVAQITSSIAPEERKAIHLLLKRLDAFNTKDLEKLQEVDIVSRQLTKEQFDSWIAKYDHFTLLYVAISDADSTSITGSCYYTRELVNGMTLHGNTDLAAMTFTLSQTSSGWKLTESGSLSNQPIQYSADTFAALKEKSLKKYNTENLATLWQSI